jgi:hypothetical protein
MVLALGAGKLFKLDSGGEYEETIIGKLCCIIHRTSWPAY